MARRDPGAEYMRFAADITVDQARMGQRVLGVMRKTVTDIERDAKTAAPVDTGNLRGSISSSVTGRANGTIRGEVGPTARYGHFPELGTSRMRPQPYLFPATRKHEDTWHTAMAQAAKPRL